MNSKKYVWEDTTSYTRSKPREEQPATTWTLNFERFRLVVWKSRYEGIGFCCTVHGDIESGEHQLKSRSGEGARIEALDFVQSRIDAMYRDVNENRAKVKGP